MYPILEWEATRINLFNHGGEFIGWASQKPASLKCRKTPHLFDLLTSRVANFPNCYLQEKSHSYEDYMKDVNIIALNTLI